MVALKECQEVKGGQVVMLSGRLYMMCRDDSIDYKKRLMDLETGRLVTLDYGIGVEPVKAKVVVE